MSAPAIEWHKRMEARVAAGIVLLVALSLAAVVFTATRVATRSALGRATGNLEDAGAAFYRLVDERASFAGRQTRLIVALPIFRSVMTNPDVAEDTATLTQIADGYRSDLGAQFAVITDPQGKATAAPGWPRGLAFPAALGRAIHDAIGGHSQHEIAAIDGKLFLIASEPARFAEIEVLGSVTFGFPLDLTVSRRTRRHHSRRRQPGFRGPAGGQQPRRPRTAGARRRGGGWRSHAGLGVSADPTRLGDRAFVNTFRSSATGGRPKSDISFCCRTGRRRRRFLDELRNALLLAHIGAFAIALAGGLIFSHRTSRPFMDLAAAAGAIAAGDWKRRVPARGSAEAIKMAEAFNDMTRSLRDQAERLRASYERFSTVTQSARDAIVSTDESGQITFWSRSAEAAFGYLESEVLRQPIDADREVGSGRLCSICRRRTRTTDVVTSSK
jgi:PAS domain-containing protein